MSQPQDFAQFSSAFHGSQDDHSLATMGNQETAWPYRMDRLVASAPEPTPETTNLTQTLADLGQPRSSRETTTGDMNTAEKQEDKDVAETEENKAKNKLKEIIDMQSPQSVTVLAHDQTAVNINVNILNGNIVVARGHNTGYPHVTVSQHTPGPQRALDHPHDYGRCDSYRPNYPRHR